MPGSRTPAKPIIGTGFPEVNAELERGACATEVDRSHSSTIDMVPDATVLVLGAGPTGLLLASEFRRRGVGIHLIDAHRGPLHWDRATVVHPRSLGPSVA